MNAQLSELPLDERLRLVEDLWDSIAAEAEALALTDAQRKELDRRLEAHEAEQSPGRSADKAVAAMRHHLQTSL